MLILNILGTLHQVGYLASLGQARTAEVKRDAIIGLTLVFFFVCIVVIDD